MKNNFVRSDLFDFIGKMTFHVVCFENDVKVIKSSWIECAKSAESKNCGIKPSKEVKIFHSTRPNQKADFSLEGEYFFDEDKTGCYIGFLLAVFGE